METLSPWKTGFKSRCPRCGQGRLYSSYLKVGECCESCALNYGFENAGDGAVPFLILIIGAVGVSLGMWVLLVLETPVWVAIAVALPVIMLLTVVLLPKVKGLLIALQYVHKAGDAGADGDGYA